MSITEIYPQVIIIALSVYSLIKHVAYHGELQKPSRLTTPIFTLIIASLLSLQIYLLYVGGFHFLSLPGVGVAFFVIFGMGLLIRNHRLNTPAYYNGWSSFMSSVITHLLFFLGGFYDVFGGL